MRRRRAHAHPRFDVRLAARVLHAERPQTGAIEHVDQRVAAVSPLKDHIGPQCEQCFDVRRERAAARDLGRHRRDAREDPVDDAVARLLYRDGVRTDDVRVGAVDGHERPQQRDRNRHHTLARRRERKRLPALIGDAVFLSGLRRPDANRCRQPSADESNRRGGKRDVSPQQALERDHLT